MSTPELRRKWIDYWNECDRIRDRYNKWWREERRRLTAEWRENPILYPRVKLPSYPLYRPPTPPFPDELMGLTWGAKTRAGTPCKLASIYRNGRCKFHGGLSTGPKTEEGKKRSAMNGFKRKSKWTPWQYTKLYVFETHELHEDLTKLYFFLKHTKLMKC